MLDMVYGDGCLVATRRSLRLAAYPACSIVIPWWNSGPVTINGQHYGAGRLRFTPLCGSASKLLQIADDIARQEAGEEAICRPPGRPRTFTVAVSEP